MSPLSFMLLFTGSLIASEPPKEDVVKEEIKKLEGTWICVSAEARGQKAPQERVKERGVRLIIKGDTWDLGDKQLSAKMTCKIDPTKKPKTADMEDMKGKCGEAIYELDGDRLKLCDAGHRDRPRPKKFETEAGTPQTLLIFEREKKK